MNQLDWARNEIELARSCSGDSELDAYYDACCISALKAYESLYNDDHSGLSWSITKSILMRLMNDEPLSRITDDDFTTNSVIEDTPEWLKSRGLISDIQCSRMSSLFKKTYEDGRVEYLDIYRTRTYSGGSDVPYNSGWVNRIVHEMYPITMPYYPEHFIAYVDEFKSPNCKSDYDCAILKSLQHPDGTVEDINKYCIECNGSFIEVTKDEFDKFKEGV